MGKDQRAGGLGVSLKSIREIKGFSLRDVEKKTGISNAYLSQIESGKVKNPSPHYLHKLSKLYDVDYMELMGLAGYIEPTVDKTTTASNIMNVALSTVEDLTNEEKKQVADFIRYLRSRRK